MHFSQRTLDYMRELVPGEFPAVGLENAQHYVFLDQPLAFVDALNAIARELTGELVSSSLAMSLGSDRTRRVGSTL